MEKSKKTIIIITILIILIILLGGYIIYDKINSNSNSNTNINEIEEKETSINNTNTTKETAKDTIKIYTDKEYVYDAEYTKNVSTDTYTTLYNETYNVKDIVVPYININSKYAEESNTEIKNVFDSAVNTFKEGISEKIAYVDKCNYEKYQKDDILSIVLTYGVGGTDVVNPEYYTYNINLKNGKEVTYNEICTLLVYDSNNIEQKVKETITNVMKEKMAQFENVDFNTYNNKSIENYKKSVDNNTLKYFINEKGRLSVVVKLSIPAGDQEFNTIIEI